MTFFLLLMFGEGALYAVLLIGIGSVVYDYVRTVRKNKPDITQILPAVDELAA
jgi:hypothetical protein